MYAIIKTGGKQYTVRIDDVVKIEKINATPGEKVIFDQILAVKDKSKEAVFGTPLVKGASVECEFIGNKSDKKIRVFKMKEEKVTVD